MDLLKGRIQRYIFTGGPLKDPHKSLTYIFIPLNTIKFSKSNLIFSVLLFSLSRRGWTAVRARTAVRRRRQRHVATSHSWRAATLGGVRVAVGGSGARCQAWLQHGRWIRRHRPGSGWRDPPLRPRSAPGRRIHRLRPRLARVSVFQFWEFYFFLEFYFTCSSHKHQYKNLIFACAARAALKNRYSHIPFQVNGCPNHIKK